MFGLSVGRGNATPGSVLMNLRYRNEGASQAQEGLKGNAGPGLGRLQRAAFGCGYVLLPYLWSRALQAASQARWADR